MIELLALAAIDLSIPAMVQIIVTLLIFGCIVGCLFWLIQVVPVPEPYKGYIKIVLTVLVILVIIGMLLNFAGFPIVQFR